MSIKFLSCTLCFCFYVMSLQGADNKPHAQRQIESWNQLLNVVRERKQEREKQHVNFELPVRQGPRVEGDPNQSKTAKDAK